MQKLVKAQEADPRRFCRHLGMCTDLAHNSAAEDSD